MVIVPLHEIKSQVNFTILDNWVFEDFILVVEPFSKALRIFEIYVSVNNDLCKKLTSLLESPTKFDEIFYVTWVKFF